MIVADDVPLEVLVLRERVDERDEDVEDDDRGDPAAPMSDWDRFDRLGS